MEYVKGPDFPTGGIVINKDELYDAYATGKGRARIRGEYNIETHNGKDSIVFHSIPYKVSKEKLIIEIDKLCEEGKISGVTSIRDESNHEGVRFVIELGKGVSAEPIIAKLFKNTGLETTYSFNQVALVDKKPRLLNLKQLIEIYIEHQKDVLIRKTNFELDKAKARLHILEGLLIALNNIDDVIVLIKNSKNATEAKTKLMSIYSLTEIQAKAILDMKLSKLAKLEKEEIENEKKDIENEIVRLKAILENPIPELTKIFNYIKNTYGDSRRSIITQVAITKEEKEIEFVEPEKCVVVMTESGLIKRIPSSSFRKQRRNTKGVKSQADITNMVIRTNTIDNLMIFTNKGKMYRLLVNDIPVGTNVSQGQSIKSLIAMDIDEEPTIMYSIYRDTDAKYVLFITKNGLVKKTSLDEYVKTKKKTGIAAINLKENDELVSVSLIKDEDLILLTNDGIGIKFSSNEISPSGRTTFGVKGITLKEGDHVITGLPIRNNNDDLALFAENGLAKKIKLTELPIQKRAGKGLICYKPTNITGKLSCAALVSNEDNILICGKTTNLCISAKEIPELNRISIGNQIIKNNKVIGVSKI